MIELRTAHTADLDADARSAIRRLLEPREVASLVVYLCSDAAAGITGTALDIDLGWTAR